jgi:hypothetical protein
MTTSLVDADTLLAIDIHHASRAILFDVVEGVTASPGQRP